MFVQLPQAKHKSVAFLPHTFRYISPLASPVASMLAMEDPHPMAYGSSGYRVGGYWHEIQGERHVACLGMILVILNNKHLPSDAAQLTYEQMLPLADGHRDFYTGYIQYTAARKVGGAKEYTREQVFASTGLSMLVFNTGELDAMREDIMYLPENTDGWYVKRPGVKL